MMDYQQIGANQLPHIGNTQLMPCPACIGTSSQGPTTRAPYDRLYKCTCCNGEKSVRMAANGALYQLSAFKQGEGV